MMAFALAAVYFLPYAPVAEPAKYANPTLLVEAEELVKIPADKVRILDVRGKEKYEAGHVPGSVLAEIGPWSKKVIDNQADGPYWKQALAAVGVSPKVPVVIVAEDIRDAARAWWLLSYAGATNVALLNGGWTAYTAAKLPVSKVNTTATAEPAEWPIAPNRKATKDDLLALLKEEKGSATIVDARSPGEFTGTEKLATQAGHIPGAAHLEWTDLLDAKTKKFVSPEALAKLFADRKIDLGKPCVTYCQSGGRAAVLAFGLTLMGAKDVKNYYKSWSEWGNAKDTPVEKK